MQWYIVVGRVEFDDEDSLFIFQANNLDEARREGIYRLLMADDDALSTTTVYINYVVACGQQEPQLLLQDV